MDIVFGKEKDYEKIAKQLNNNFIAINEKPKITIQNNIKNLSKKIDLIYNLEDSTRNDFIHHRNSGLNHIMARELNQKEIAYAFSFNLVLKKGTRVIPRMKQNVKLCRKYKVKMLFASFATTPYEMRSLKDLESFAKTIGMNSKEIKDSYNIIEEKIIFNEKKKAGKIPADGVEVLN